MEATASAAPPPRDGLHWKPVAKVFETFRERYGRLAEDKFSEWMDGGKRWFRWTAASGWPRKLTHRVLPSETPIRIEDERALDPDDEDEIEIYLNGEACCGWLAVWDPPVAAAPKRAKPAKRAKRAIPPKPPPAAAVPESPPVSSTQPEPAAPSPQPTLEQAKPAIPHAGGADPIHDWENAAKHVDAWVDPPPASNHRRPLPCHPDGSPNLTRAVELMTEYFNKQKEKLPKERSMRRWINRNMTRCQHWWVPD